MIGQRLELKLDYFSLCTIFAQCSSSSSPTSQKWSLRLSCGWLVRNTVDDCLQGRCSTNLQIKNRSSSCQCWYLDGIQTWHFICYQFGCKFWLRSINNHARHHFQAFAHFHLKIEVTVLSNSNLSRHPFLRQVVDLDLLLCTGFYSGYAVLFLRHNFTQRPWKDRKIEQGDLRCFGRQELMTQWLRWVAVSRATWVRIQHGTETFLRPSVILRGTEPVTALKRALLYCFALYNFVFLGFRQWWSRADKVLTLNMNIRLPLFWSAWSRARGQDSPHVRAWLMGLIIAIAEPRSKSDERCLAIVFPWIVENT